MQPQQLRRHTWEEFLWKIEGHRKQKAESDLKDWERARLIAFYAVLPHLKNKNTKIERFLPLPSDKNAKNTRGIKGQIAEIKGMMDAYESTKTWTKEKQNGVSK